MRLALRVGWQPLDERRWLVAERRASYGGAKRGPKPRHGEALSIGVLVKVTPTMKVERIAAAKRLRVASLAEYLRELHALFLKAEATFRN